MNLSIPKDVKQYFIEKKYYKKYFYKICLKVDESLIKPKATFFSYRTQFAVHDAQKSLLREIAGLPVADAECRIRSEGRSISVFTNDLGFIEQIFDKLSHRVEEFHSPINDEHQKVLDQNIRIRVRKRLFENSFRYKVYLINRWQLTSDSFRDVKEWLEGIENVDNSRWAVNKSLQRNFNESKFFRGYTPAMYLNEPEDLMMCQMRFHSDIQYIEEAVLISSL
jgi:hypothetical protein